MLPEMKATKLTGLVLLSRFSDAAVPGSALRAPFSQLVMDPRSLSFQSLAHLRRAKDERCLLAENPGASQGQRQWLLLSLLLLG